MEKANPWMGKIVVARWLYHASSIIIYLLVGEVESDSKWHHSCLYDWDRITKVDRKGKGRDGGD
ncbi:hypothetical protein BDZ91DRAFT_731425, partial [Kalaharituber pfeilii]